MLVLTDERSGGSILITLGEGGESRYDTNVNFFLEDYGIAINADAVGCTLTPNGSKMVAAAVLLAVRAVLVGHLSRPSLFLEGRSRVPRVD